MGDSYLPIPTLFSDPVHNTIALTFIPGIFYTLAAYGKVLFSGLSMVMALIVAIVFAAIEYTFRVPLVHYASNTAKLSNGAQQTIWVVVTLILGFMSDYFH